MNAKIVPSIVQQEARAAVAVRQMRYHTSRTARPAQARSNPDPAAAEAYYNPEQAVAKEEQNNMDLRARRHNAQCAAHHRRWSRTRIPHQ